MTETASRRVFFALWPPAETLQAIDALADVALSRCSGRRTRRENLHMTLAFIGSVSDEQLEVLKAVAGSIRSEPFELQFDRLGCWPHNQIAWLGCRRLPSGARRLYEHLAEGLAAAGFVLEKRRFAPHVTLVRKARCATLPDLERPLDWQAGDFVLVESVLEPQGSNYRMVARWPLFCSPDKKNAKGC